MFNNLDRSESKRVAKIILKSEGGDALLEDVQVKICMKQGTCWNSLLDFTIILTFDSYIQPLFTCNIIFTHLLS